MPRFPRLPAARLVQWTGVLATLLMLAVLAWLAATVFWSLNTPASIAPPVAIETDAVRAAQNIAARHLFGEATPVARAAVKATALPDIVLRGVVAPSQTGRTGAAIFVIAGKPAISVRTGEEVAPGVKLTRVLPGSVELERGGQAQVLSLAERGKGGPPRKDAAAAQTPSQTPSAPERGKGQAPRKDSEESGG